MVYKGAKFGQRSSHILLVAMLGGATYYAAGPRDEPALTDEDLGRIAYSSCRIKARGAPCCSRVVQELNV